MPSCASEIGVPVAYAFHYFCARGGNAASGR